MLRHGEQVDWSVSHATSTPFPPPPPPARARQRAASTSQATASETLRIVYTTHQAMVPESPSESPPLKRKRKEPSTQSSRRRKASVDVTPLQHPPQAIYLPPPPQVEPIGGFRAPIAEVGEDHGFRFRHKLEPAASPPIMSSLSPPSDRPHNRQQTPQHQRLKLEPDSHPQPPPFHPRPSYPLYPPDPEQTLVKPAHRRSQSSVTLATPTTTKPMASASTSVAAEGNTLPPLSLSILGVEPLDEFIKEIADFVHHMIVNRPEHLGGLVEVEAKVGVLRESRGNSRIHIPVLVESILQPDALDVRFESNMSVAQHKHYNQLLNALKTSSDSPSHPTSPVHYSHLYLVDSFYADNDPGMSNGDRRLRGADKIRVTRDEKTNTVVQCVKKIRLGDLNIYSPKRAADWRISVNLEVPCKHPLGSATHSRKKDRLRYSHEEFMIDLTQVVSQTSPGAPPQTLHELELEVARPELLLETAAKRNDLNCSEHERSAFDELIRAFVNNARILVRNSIPFDH